VEVHRRSVGHMLWILRAAGCDLAWQRREEDNSGSHTGIKD
jgi:hypothetical protein